MADPAGPGHVDANSNLDYLLALSLQNENGGGGEGELISAWNDVRTDCGYTHPQNLLGVFNNQPPSDLFPASVNVDKEVASKLLKLLVSGLPRDISMVIEGSIKSLTYIQTTYFTVLPSIF